MKDLVLPLKKPAIIKHIATVRQITIHDRKWLKTK